MSLQDVRVQHHQEAVFEFSVALSLLLGDADLTDLPEITKDLDAGGKSVGQQAFSLSLIVVIVKEYLVIFVRSQQLLKGYSSLVSTVSSKVKMLTVLEGIGLVISDVVGLTYASLI